MSIADLYGELRPRAFSIAYQMLGSVSEAEDVVQEAFMRMHQTLQREEQINSPPAFIATLVTRLAIDHLRSARARRERYVGEWLPEPLATGPTAAERAETGVSLSLAFLVLLESLTPQQRAAFLLREVFDYPYMEVAEIVGTSVDSTRHLVARARSHCGSADRATKPLGNSERSWLSTSSPPPSRASCPRWRRLLAQDVALHVDGGGKVPALTRPLHGRERVARTLSVGMSHMGRRGARLQVTEVNGQPGAGIIDADDRLVGVMALDIAGGQIQTIHSIANPDKLRHLDQAGQLGALLSAGRRSGNDD